MSKKFVPGDQAIVTGDTVGLRHGFDVGATVIVERMLPNSSVYSGPSWRCHDERNKRGWWVGEPDLDPIGPTPQEVDEAVQSILSGATVTKLAQEAVEPIPAVVYTVVVLSSDINNGGLLQLLGIFKTLEAAQKRAIYFAGQSNFDAPVWEPYEDDQEVIREGKIIRMWVSQDIILDANRTLMYITEQEVQDGLQ